MAKIRVTRTIIMEGDDKWIDMTLSKSLKVGKPIKGPGESLLYESNRQVQALETSMDEATKDNF